MLLKGKAVSDAIMNECIIETNELKEKGRMPSLAVFRVGSKDSDLSYERTILKRCAEIGIQVINYIYEEDVNPDLFYEQLDQANRDPQIHGILVFRPLPKIFDDEKVRNSILPEKDIDGCGDLSLAGILTGKQNRFAPCTAEAVIAILDHYKIPISGKHALVLGRSLVIGKPVAMMLLSRNATVSICHSKSANIQDMAAKADLLICATGKMESVDHSYVNPHQTVIDVGIAYNEIKQKLCGDVLFEEVEPLVENITPVPGGVGSVTSSILVRHVIQACKAQNK